MEGKRLRAEIMVVSPYVWTFYKNLFIPWG
nr:MAG TPA: hypothetical protein [Inoviridae sp.]DAW85964.1 MAG TPA: hypothetical protein [Inoviridae sp.]